MGYSVLIAKGTDIYDITQYTGDISWSDSIDTLGMQFRFSTGFSDERFFPAVSAEVGDIVTLRNGSEIFRGVIVTQALNTDSRCYTAFDFCWYLNKSKLIKQFNGINAAAAIGQLCAELNIPVGGIDAMRSDVNHIYYDKTASEILKDILERENGMTGKRYLTEMRGGSFYVFERTSIPVKAMFKPADNIAAFDSSLAVGSPSRTLSIEEMKNSVLVISNSEKSVRTLAAVKDEAGVKKYGLLQEILTADKNELNTVQNIAGNKLKELNRVCETISLSMPGDDGIRSGRVLSVTEVNTGIAGDYLITCCGHSLSGGVHIMELELEAV